MSDELDPGESEVVELIRAIDVSAPADLHERVARMLDEPGFQRPTSNGRPLLRVGLAVSALAAALIVIAVSLATSGGSARLTLAEASAVALRPATMAAPGVSPGDRLQLTIAVEGIAFPNWGERFGWRAEGSREDRLDGRAIKTVSYEDGQGHRLGYAIVAGKPAPAVSGGSIDWRGGEAYRLSRVGGEVVVTWERDGRLCVMTGRGVDSATLLKLAS
jgi:hypothetical protein